MSGALQAVYANFRSSAVATYIEDVFSTYLYTGNGSTQTIANGIDLSGKGGLVWVKDRTSSNWSHNLVDSARGNGNVLSTDLTDPQYALGRISLASNGFNLTNNSSSTNASSDNYASWTFRKQPKFFDIVTYTGDGNFSRQINHSLGSTPGCVIIKRTDTEADWVAVCRRNNTTLDVMYLNQTSASLGGVSNYPTTSAYVSPTTFGPEWYTVTGVPQAAVNASGGTYVAYLFAHDAGGFGATGTDNVISCGGYTGNGSATGPIVTLGYEPQWLMIKNAGGTGNWQIIDNMRGLPVGGADATLQANLSNAESSVDYVSPTATGFQIVSTNTQVNSSTTAYIYIAIRRPMKTPTTGTQVFSPNISSGSSTTTITTGITTDLAIYNLRGGTAANSPLVDRLRGFSNAVGSTSNTLISSTTAAETGYNVGYNFWNTGFNIGSYFGGNSNVFYSFSRAPSFFDIVCYTGDATATRNITHNLGVVPQLIITKNRTGTAWDWAVYQAPTYGTTGFDCMKLNTTGAANQTNAVLYPSAPTASYYTIANFVLNDSGKQYVSYLFGNCPGVSKIGSYTGTGATLNINAGFTTGARFVMIKRTDSTGDWWVWDTARGMVSGTDPRLALNSTAAEVNANWVYTASSGFQIVTTDATVNASGGSYIYLAIA